MNTNYHFYVFFISYKGAVSSDQTFSKYIVPAGPIDQEASDLHGLYIQKDKLGQFLIILKQGCYFKSSVSDY